MTTADSILSAIHDAERLTAWIEPNEWATQDPAVEAAVLRALATPVPADLSGDVPLLRFANGREPMPLLDAVLDPPIAPWLSRISAGRRSTSMHATRSPGARMIVRSMMFRNCRTLPGQSCACSAAMASSEIDGAAVLRSAANRARKWFTSSGMSSRRSRSGGRRTGTTLRR